MPYWINAKSKSGVFSVVVETAQDALAKIAELSEAGHEITVKDLCGAVIEPSRLLAEAADVGD